MFWRFERGPGVLRTCENTFALSKTEKLPHYLKNIITLNIACFSVGYTDPFLTLVLTA